MERKDLSNSEIIALMDVYLNEWINRHDTLWSQIFKFFYADLIVIVLPNIASFIGITLPEMNNIVFPIIGIIMSIVFLYISLGYVVRLRASSITYENLMNMLAREEYKRTSIKDKEKMPFSWLFSPSLAMILVITMFVILVSISIFLIIIA